MKQPLISRYYRYARHDRLKRGLPQGDWDEERRKWEAELRVARAAIAAELGIDVGFRRGATKWMAIRAGEEGLSLSELVKWLRNSAADDPNLTTKQRGDVRCALGKEMNAVKIAQANKAVAHFERMAARARKRLKALQEP